MDLHSLLRCRVCDAFMCLTIFVGGAAAASLVIPAHAQSPDPFVSAVNEKQAEMARSAGVFGDQLIRDHQVIGDQAKQINDLTKQLADLKAKTPPAAAEPEKK